MNKSHNKNTSNKAEILPVFSQTSWINLVYTEGQSPFQADWNEFIVSLGRFPCI